MSGRPTARLTAALVARQRGDAAPCADAADRDLLRAKPRAPRRAALGRTAEVTPLRASRRATAVAGSESEARARIGLRLDAERHLRLKLLAAREERSMQAVLTEALDEYLARRAPDVHENLRFGRK